MIFLKKRLLSWNRLAFLYIVFALLPVFFLTFFSLDTYRKDIKSMEHTLLDYAGLQTVSNLETAFKESKQIVAQMVTDSDVIKYSRIFDSPDSSEYSTAMAKSRLYEKISEYSYLNQYIKGAAMIGLHSDSVFMVRSPSCVFTQELMDDPDFQSDLLQYSDSKYLKEIAITGSRDFASVPQTDSLFFTYPLVDLITQRISGVLAVEFDAKLFLSVILPEQENQVIQSRISDLSAITDQEDNILICPDSSFVGQSFSDTANTYRLAPSDSNSDASYMVQTSEIGNTDLFLNLVFFKGPLLQYLSHFQQGLILYLIVISVLFLFALTVIARRLRRDTVYIENLIRQFRRDPQTPIQDSHLKDELLETISSQFHKMSREISALLLELEAKNEHIKKAAEQQKKAELKAMEAQINPHFLYNALDRINWIAIDNEQYEISDMLNGLGSLLRYSLYHIDSLVTLSAELKWMEKYIFIQSKRFGSDICFCVEAAKEAIDFPIYKMLLQPLVENSILRGFYGNPPDQKITLKARLLPGDRLEILLFDNGCGMDAAQLEKLKEIIRTHGAKHYEGVGVGNTVSRLSLYYGADYEIEVDSAPGRGCTYRIVIPYHS